MPTSERLERRLKPINGSILEPKSKWLSFVSSAAIHVLILLLLAVLWRPIARGMNADRDRPLGIAVVHHQSNSTEYFLEGGGASGKVVIDNSAATLKAIAASPKSNSQALSMDELLGDFANAAPTLLSSSANSSDAMGAELGSFGTGSNGTTGPGKGQGKDAQTKTSLFGIEGYGNSFVYVFDRSDSMNGFSGAPLRSAKRELMQSLQSITSVNQFQIIFYNESPSPYQGSLSATRRLIFGTDNEKASATEFVSGMRGGGGTEHVSALRMGTALNPDVLFFLTDAADPSLNQSQINEIVDRCTSRGTTLHSIEFGIGSNGGQGRWIEQLATRTGGKYRYVDVSKLESGTE